MTSDEPNNENSRWQVMGDKAKSKSGMAAEQEGLLVTRHLSLVTALWSLIT